MDRMAARDTLADVGADVSTAAEGHRPDAAAVAGAAFQRLQQSLRSLAEFTKLFDAGMAANMESLRYRAYTLQRAVATTGR